MVKAVERGRILEGTGRGERSMNAARRRAKLIWVLGKSFLN